MTDTIDDVLEDGNAPKSVPQIVKTLAIFSYIGNAIWALLFVIVVLAIESMMSQFINRLDAPGMSTDQLMTFMVIVCLVILLMCIVSIIGTVRMTRGKKSGFYMYAIANGIWVILLLMGGTPQGIVVGLISLGFIIGFGMQLKKFPA
jgi:magnesium-transporting ATPase (P-type)